MKHLIIGAGAAGITAAEQLRKLDPAASITVLDGEGEVAPYARMAIPYLLSNQIVEDRYASASRSGPLPRATHRHRKGACRCG